MTVAAAALVALALLLLRLPHGDAADRLRRAVGHAPAAPGRSTTVPPVALRRPVLVVGVAGALLLLGVGVGRWMLVPLAVLLVVVRGRRRHRPAPDLPLVVDLLAAALRGGALLPGAVDVAAGAATAEVAGRLAAVARALRAGVDPPDAWAPCTADPELGPVARICIRTGGSGAAAAGELERLARRLRARRRTDADARGARAAIWVVLPLCLCFLPAFVLVGVVPMAAGLLDSVR